MRVGLGYDVHRLEAGRPLILGGMHIPSPVGLLGHSDADVLVHAIIDALLGAAALGDIGAHFPDTDEKWRGADSVQLLESVSTMIGREGFTVANIDATVVIEKPKLRPYIDQMRENIARACKIDVVAVSVKATTSEGLGFVGSAQGVAAHAICLLSPRT
ncbi:MAG: 2-C-methyl-D-erythritol 2,4-cyclodiphosphate synthase [Rhodothermales bacterium]